MRALSFTKPEEITLIDDAPVPDIADGEYAVYFGDLLLGYLADVP